ncbi:MAG: hypothetical protein HY784_13210 [Chloroflexi bacterium]|nr:hypothetical protein [Chloroflexota bacterium]
MSALANVLGFVITWAVWLWLANRQLPVAASLAIAAGGALMLIPLVLAGRWLLDRQPTVAQARRVTTVVHYLLAIFLGSAVLEATRLGLDSPAWPIPVPAWLGVVVMGASGLLLLVAVLNLAVKGLGAPFAIAFTRAVAADWLYAWTRNPLVISALAFLVGLGLWLRSGLFLVWVLIVVSPAVLMMLSVYEERELEIRFGQAYLDYKARTPMLWPRRPRKE